MNLKELIMLSDIYAPQAYADFAEMPWGIMFYDSNNPTMHDVNHACIINDSDFASALADIRSFYIQKKLVPRIYLAGAQHRDFKDVLEKQGFAISRFGDFSIFCLQKNALCVKVIIFLLENSEVKTILLRNCLIICTAYICRMTPILLTAAEDCFGVLLKVINAAFSAAFMIMSLHASPCLLKHVSVCIA